MFGQSIRQDPPTLPTPYREALTLGQSPPAGQLVHCTRVHYCHVGWSQRALCEQQRVSLPKILLLSHPIHRCRHTHTHRGTSSSSYPKLIWAWSPGRTAKGPAEAIWAASHLCAKGVQSDLSVDRELEISYLGRREEAMYLSTPSSKEGLSQGLLSWEHGFREIKTSPSFSPDRPQAHLFFKDLSVALCLNMSMQSRSCAIPFLQPKSRRTGMTEAVLET